MGDAVLVTGGAGFVGSHALLALAEAGWRPVAFDDLSRGHADAVRGGPLVRGDVRDPAAVESAIRAHGATAVLHFAALAYVGESVRDPGPYWDVNVRGTWGVLEGARRAGVGRVVFSSSCATYGVPFRLPIREGDPQAPVNPYGATKLAGERMLRDWSAAHGLRWAALRYFNAAGADPLGRLGERHEPETHLIPLALRAASGQGGPLRILGTDYPTPDGTALRDYVHVADLARAHVLALAHLAGGGDSLALNLGSGRATSVREVARAVGALSGRSLPTLDEPRREGDPPVLVADATAARAALGWSPALSDLPTILAHAAPWFGLAPRHAA